MPQCKLLLVGPTSASFTIFFSLLSLLSNFPHRVESTAHRRSSQARRCRPEGRRAWGSLAHHPPPPSPGKQRRAPARRSGGRVSGRGDGGGGARRRGTRGVDRRGCHCFTIHHLHGRAPVVAARWDSELGADLDRIDASTLPSSASFSGEDVASRQASSSLFLEKISSLLTRFL